MIELTITQTQVIDIETILSIEANPNNSQFILSNSKEEHLDLIKDKNIEHLILRVHKKMIGFVILAGIRNNNKSIEFRRIIIQEKGKGFGRAAIKEIKRYCFEKLQCHRLWLDVLKTNKRARYLYQSEGFKEEGELREALFVNNEYEDLIIMSILESEFRNLK